MNKYTRMNWENTPSKATPLTADNLNHMDEGIEQATDGAIALETEIATARGGSNSLGARLDTVDTNLAKKADKANQGEIGATLSGSVVKVLVEKGQAVTKGTPLVVTEAMKMETTIAAPISGIVAQIHVTAGNRIESGDCLLEIELKA